MKWRAGNWRGEIKLTVQSQLTVLRAQTVDEFEAVVETDLTDAEITSIGNGLAEYAKHPETAISFDDFIAREYPAGLPPVKCHWRYAEETALRKIAPRPAKNNNPPRRAAVNPV